MNELVASLLCAALVVWSVALLRELWALMDPHQCDRRLRRAGLPSWLRAQQWWAIHSSVLAVLISGLVWTSVSGSWCAALALTSLLGLAWRAPSLWLQWRIRSRRAALRRDLPGALSRLCLATHCVAPFEEALQLTLRWGPGGLLSQVLQQQLLQAPRWPRPRLNHPLTPLVAELIEAGREAKAGLLDHAEQLQRWRWLLVRSRPTARPAYHRQRRHAGVPAEAARDIEFK